MLCDLTLHVDNRHNQLLFRTALSCKQGYELQIAIESKSQPNWFCHFDDDTFLNFDRLKSLLGEFDPLEDHYFGKRTISEPISIPHHLDGGAKKLSKPFFFGTGGAGWCLSKSVLSKLAGVIE